MGGEPPSYPLRLRGLDLTRTGGDAGEGTLALSALAIAAAGQAEPQLVEGFTEPKGWWSAGMGSGQSQPVLTPGAAIPRLGSPTLSVTVKSTRSKLLLRPPPGDRPIPALISAATATRLGLELNQPFTFKIGGQNVSMVAVAQVAYFPSLYPQDGEFLVAARDPLLAILARGGASQAWPNEIWMKLSPPDARKAVMALRQREDVLQILDRRSMETAANQQSLRLNLDAGLLIGFVAALMLAIFAFALHFFLATRARLDEYAILQANGLPQATILRTLHLEQAVILIYGVLVGAGLGLVLAWAILPSLELGTSLSETVPPTVFTVDPLLSLAAALGVVVGSALGGRLATSLGGRFQLIEQLRGLA
jgi:hypothetical protein